MSAALLVPALLLMLPGAAAAHTGFESSDPSDGAVVGEPVTVVVLRFTGPAAVAGEGFLVRLPTGEVVEPSAVVEGDGTIWRLGLSDPITDGVVAVRWEVKAPDAHPIAGSFSFTVAATGPDADSEQLVELETVERDVVVLPEVPSTSAPGRATSADVSPTVKQFLADNDRGASGVSLLGYVSRLLGLGGTVAVVGLLVFATFVLRASDPERVGLVESTGLLGLLVLVGAVGEAIAQTVGVGPWATASEGSSWVWLLESKAGTAVVLRAVGGLAVVGGVWHTRRRFHLVPRSRVALKVPDVMASPTASVGAVEREVDEPPPRHELNGASLVLAVGVGLLLTAVVFDGHTVTSGRWLTTALVDVVHVGAAGVWAGGVFGLGVVLVGRRRRSVALDGLRLGMRFSGVAALASALAGVAGVGLAVIILESLDELVGTGWGRVLIAKTLFVAAAASIGAYNHFVVLRAGPVNETEGTVISGRLQRLVIAEASILLVVLGLTALLVASNSG